jgi:hypothetical protein
MAYARIDEGFWTDPKIRGLSLEGKMIAAWLFTNPHRHFSGLYYLPIVLIPHEIGLSIGVSEKQLNILEELEFIKYSHKFSVVWVCNMLKHQSGDKRLSPQQVVGIQKQLSSLHGCPLIKEFIIKYQLLGVFYDGKIDTPTDTPTDTKSQSKSKSQSKDKDIPIPKSKKTETPLPDDFKISESVKTWATAKGFNRLEDHLEAFRDYALSRGKLYADWDSAFKRAIREDWARLKGNGGLPQRQAPLSKADQVTAGNLAARERLLKKYQEQGE